MFRLSERAKTLLVLIGDYSEIDLDGRYWIPSSNRHGQWSDTLRTHVYVSGAGDAAAIKALWKRGLVNDVKKFGGMPIRYASRITENGRLLVERMRETDTLPKFTDSEN